MYKLKGWEAINKLQSLKEQFPTNDNVQNVRLGGSVIGTIVLVAINKSKSLKEQYLGNDQMYKMKGWVAIRKTKV